MSGRVRRGAAGIAAVVVASLALTACGDSGSPKFVSGSETPGVTPSASGSAAPDNSSSALSITPAANTKNVPVSAEIGVKLTGGGQVGSVTLTEEGGKAVSGKMREDGTSWVPGSQLKWGKTYTATVTANTSGGDATQTTTFTTMAKPSKKTGTGLYLFDDRTYGVAMPVVVEFNPGIPAKNRAAVEKRMFVSSSPSQPGVWHWVSSGTQAFYRSKEYWQPGTTLTVRIALGGLPTGGGRYGDQDRKATGKIGERVEMTVDNKTKKMTVFKNGKAVKAIPVSLGKKSTPSASGIMVVMEKKAKTVFDTRDAPDPENRYVVDIEYAQRLTWSGQYIHAAPWSNADQGRRNVSHGCLNMSTANAQWLFGQTKIGDPVTVIGTEDKLSPGDGWTAWNMSWKQFIKGSALPIPDNLQ